MSAAEGAQAPGKNEYREYSLALIGGKNSVPFPGGTSGGESPGPGELFGLSMEGHGVSGALYVEGELGFALARTGDGKETGYFAPRDPSTGRLSEFTFDQTDRSARYMSLAVSVGAFSGAARVAACASLGVTRLSRSYHSGSWERLIRELPGVYREGIPEGHKGNADFGTSRTAFLIGGGLRWFATRRVALRIDYRAYVASGGLSPTDQRLDENLVVARQNVDFLGYNLTGGIMVILEREPRDPRP